MSFWFFRQMIFSSGPDGQHAAAEARGMPHGVVELQPGRVHAADQLAGAQRLRGRHVALAHLGDAAVVLAEADRRALPGHGGEPDDRALRRLAVDLGQHHVGGVAGEGAFALDRRQLAGIAEHQDRLAEAHQVARHLLADHGDLVEHDELRIRRVALRIEREARLLHLRERLAHRLDAGLGGGALEAGQRADAALRLAHLLRGGLDLLLGRLEHAVDQAVDGARRRALVLEHVGRLAGEGRGDHAGHAAAVALALVRRQAELVEGEAQHGALAGAGIAEHPEDLLLGGAVLEPVPDIADGRGLRG